jgi:hypothetical protein
MARVAKKKAKKVSSTKKPAAAKKRAAAKPAPQPVKKRAVAKKAAKAKKRPDAAATTRKATAPRKNVVAAKKVAKKTSAKAAPKASNTPPPRPRKHTRMDGANAFLPDVTSTGHKRVRDDFAEELGEEFVATVTSGESVDDARDAPVPEEEGGPFVTTRAREEFGRGRDASNPKGTEREPFPTTRGDGRP